MSSEFNFFEDDVFSDIVGVETDVLGSGEVVYILE